MSQNKKRKKQSTEETVKKESPDNRMFYIFLGIAVAALVLAVTASIIITMVLKSEEAPLPNSDSTESSSTVTAEPVRFTEGDLRYEVTGESTVTLTYYVGSETAPAIRIPSSVRGYTVTAIIEYAFLNKEPSSIYIPKTVKTIGQAICGDYTSMTVTYEGSAEDFLDVRVEEAFNDWATNGSLVFDNE